MPILTYMCEIEAPLQQVWEFHNNVESLFVLTPPDKHAKLEGAAEPMRVGVVYHIKVRQFGIIPIQMHSKITDYTPPTGFDDIQVKGPFAAWKHQHRFTALSDTRTRLTDTVTYSVPFGFLGRIADALFVRRDLDKMFAYRHKVTRQMLEKS